MVHSQKDWPVVDTLFRCFDVEKMVSFKGQELVCRYESTFHAQKSYCDLAENFAISTTADIEAN